MALLASTPPAQATARAYPPPSANPIDEAALHTGAPRVAGNNFSREKLLQNLRATAQAERALPGSAPQQNRKQRSAPVRAATGELNAPEAAWLLGLLTLHGLAMPADPSQAQQWFERAYMLSHPLAPAGLAWCQLTGCVTRPNPAAALEWIALVRRVDTGLASYLEWHVARELAPLPETSSTTPRGYGTPGSADAPRPEVQKLLLDAARLGNPHARNELGLEYLSRGNLDQALAHFVGAASRSEAAAANAALLKERIKAADRTAPGAARNSAADWYLQARRYHRGEGVPSNYAEAVRLYQIAASSGDSRARKMLELIFSRPAPDAAVDIGWMQQLATLDPGIENTPPVAPAVTTSYIWQRDPTPLYAFVPSEWRAPDSLR